MKDFSLVFVLFVCVLFSDVQMCSFATFFFLFVCLRQFVLGRSIIFFNDVQFFIVLFRFFFFLLYGKCQIFLFCCVSEATAMVNN